MPFSKKRFIYNAVCTCVAAGIACLAMMPVPAATASAMGLRGGQAYCPSGGCHDRDTHCSGSVSCHGATATACFQGDNDRNHERCSPDTGQCRLQGCEGVDSECGGR